MTTRTMPLKILILALIFMAVHRQQAACFPLKALDDRKQEIVIPARPERIVSLAPTNTELLFALGLGRQVVGVTRYCDYPAEARQKEKVGGFIDFDLEKITALKPDLVLAFGTMQLPVVADLEKRGVKVFWIYPHTVDQVLDSFGRVGRMTGKEREARQLRTSVAREITALRSAFAGLPADKRPSVFRVMSFNTPATIGADSFQSDLFSVSGGRNAFPVPNKDYVDLTAEQLATGNPSVVLVCGDDQADLAKRVKQSRLYKNLPAVQKGSLLVLPCELTCRPGPRIGEMARRLAVFLHPEIDVRNQAAPAK